MSTKHIGFSGTREGMTKQQSRKVSALICKLEEGSQFHHGDCVGADAAAHEVAREAGLKIALHPPKNPQYRAFCDCDILYGDEDYIERNHRIVDMTDWLIAAPLTMFEERRSGTWATIRYARTKGKPIIIVLPNGSIIKEPYP